jgi:hypothetical protein
MSPPARAPDRARVGARAGGALARGAAGDGGRQPDARQLLRRRQSAAAGGRRSERGHGRAPVSRARAAGRRHPRSRRRVDAAGLRPRDPESSCGACCRCCVACARPRARSRADQRRHPPRRGRRSRRWQAGAAIINDISGLADPAMAEVVARTGAGLVLGHLRGEPATMQQGITSPISSPRSPRARSRRSSARCGPASRVAHHRRSGHRLRQDRRAEHRAGGRLAFLARETGCPVLIGASRKAFLGASPASRSVSG